MVAKYIVMAGMVMMAIPVEVMGAMEMAKVTKCPWVKSKMETMVAKPKVTSMVSKAAVETTCPGWGGVDNSSRQDKKG